MENSGIFHEKCNLCGGVDLRKTEKYEERLGGAEREICGGVVTLATWGKFEFHVRSIGVEVQ